jgi:hypothetical protein
VVVVDRLVDIGKRLRLDALVAERRFAMVDMGDDGEIADVGGVGHCARCLAAAS